MLRLFFGTLIVSLSILYSNVRDTFAADIIFVPSSGTITSDSFTVDVYVSGNTQPINGVSAAVSFPTTQLSVASISKAGSIINLWAEEPSYSNTAGTVRFEGVILNPGFSGARGKVGSIRFIKKPGSQGQSVIRISSGSVLANDGKATNVTRTLGSGSFTLVQATTAPVVPTAPQTPVPASGITPLITSTTHPKEDAWYNNSVPSFMWRLPSGVSAVRLGYSASESTIPGKVYTPAIAEKALEALEDGEYWFAAQFKSGSVWGPVARYAVRIDTTPPLNFSVLQQGTSLIFTTTDESSGIDHYEVVVDDTPPVLLQALTASPYDLSAYPGEHTVKVTAVDRAGNRTQAPELRFALPKTTNEIVVEPTPLATARELFGQKTVLYGGLALLAALIFSIIWFAIIRFAVLRTKMRRDLASLEQTLQDDFLTLREHLELNAGHISPRSKVKAVTEKMFKNSKDTIELIERDITHKIENLRKRL